MLHLTRLLAGAVLVLSACAHDQPAPHLEESRPREPTRFERASVPWSSRLSDDDWDGRLEELRRLDAALVAAQMYRSNLWIFAGINGFVGNVPLGVKDLPGRLRGVLYEIVPIEGTSDFIEHGEFQDQAERFARSYNQELLRLIRTDPRHGHKFSGP